eukprot:403352965
MDLQILRPATNYAEEIVSHSSSQSHANLLTISEYDQIQNRLEDSYKILDLVKDALSNPDNMEQLRQKLEDKQNEHATLRVKVIRKQKQAQSITNPNLSLHIFKVEFIDIEQKGYAMIKHAKSKTFQLIENQNYLMDQMKLAVNKRAQIVVSTTSISVIREEKEETFTVESLELSQRDEEEEEYRRQQQFQKKPIQNRNYNNYDSDYENQIGQNYLGGVDLNSLTNFQSTKQIIQTCEEMLSEDANEESDKKLWNFRELLTWRLPDHFCTNLPKSGNNIRMGNDGFVFTNQINLYKLELITNRLKEQRVSFCGIVSHVKQNVDKQSALKNNENHNQSTSQIDLESIDDKSRVCIFVKHSNRINLKDLIHKDMVILIKNGLRKVSNTIDIYVQLQYSPKNLIVVGQIKEQINDFQASTQIQLIKTIPSDSIVRHIIKVCGFISEINFIKIQYKCDVCKTETQNESVCRNGCFIKEPFLTLQVYCVVQDGTSKASLEMKNDKVKKAFQIQDHDIRRFKDYCLKYGTYIHPSNAYNAQYRDVLNVFKKSESWTQMLYYCKAYYKTTYEKKGAMQGGAQSGAGGAGGYSDTISKPSFLLNDKKDKEVYLNGEVTALKDVPGFAGQGTRTVKRTNICLKCLQVDENLRAQAMRNAFQNRQ